MTLVRAVWVGTGTIVFKRSGVTGAEEKLLTMAGVPLKNGNYHVDWTAGGEVGASIALTVEKQTSAGWVAVASTGPHFFRHGKLRLDSGKNKPDGYVEMNFSLP